MLQHRYFVNHQLNSSSDVNICENKFPVEGSELTPFNKPSLVGDELRNIREAVRLGQLAGDGKFTRACNAHIAEMAGAKAALLTHSCTAALEMAAILCDLGPGDEVIMPSFTFVSTANAVVMRGATPVFVDILPDTLNLDPAAVAAAVTENTKAIFVVHYAGVPAAMDELTDIAETHGLRLVEDAAQALGSTYKGRPAGGLGDLATFSFHETKNIISGEGGALTINAPDLLERAEIIREKGTNRSKFYRGQVDKYTWVDIGSSYLPGELTAAFLLAQLEEAGAIYERRQKMFETYRQAFDPLAAAGRVQLPVIPSGCRGNGHMFYLLLDDLETRQTFIDEMKRQDIITPFHYVPLHSSPAGQRFGRAHGTLSVTNHVADRLVRLPMYFDLGANIHRIIETGLNILSRPKLL